MNMGRSGTGKPTWERHLQQGGIIDCNTERPWTIETLLFGQWRQHVDTNNQGLLFATAREALQQVRSEGPGPGPGCAIRVRHVFHNTIIMVGT